MYFDIDISLLLDYLLFHSISYYLNLLFSYLFMPLYLLLRYPDVQSRDDPQYERN